MRTDATFPLAWEQVAWSGSPAFPASLAGPQPRYVLTDFRLVVQRQQRIVREVALDRISDVRLTQSRWQRAAGTSSVRVDLSTGEPPLVLAHILHGPQLALVLQLRAAELTGGDSWELSAEFLRSALGPEASPLLRSRRTPVLAATLGLAILMGAFGLGQTSSPRSPAASEGSMERDVRPFARATLGPVIGIGNLTYERGAVGCYHSHPVE